MVSKDRGRAAVNVLMIRNAVNEDIVSASLFWFSLFCFHCVRILAVSFKPQLENPRLGPRPKVLKAPLLYLGPCLGFSRGVINEFYELSVNSRVPFSLTHCGELSDDII